MSNKLLLRILHELCRLNGNVDRLNGNIERLLDFIIDDSDYGMEDDMEYMEEEETEDEVAHNALLCCCDNIGSCPDCPHIKHDESAEEEFMRMLIYLLGGN